LLQKFGALAQKHSRFMAVHRTAAGLPVGPDAAFNAVAKIIDAVRASA
jgi:hypothetical protein